MKTVRFFTLGCKVNQYDTQSIRERLLQKGFREIENGRPADLCLINTCTVTANADAKSKYFIRRAIKENPGAHILVTGCLVDKDTSELSAIKGIDSIISKRFFPDGVSRFCGHTRAFLKIQDGCDNFCAYCKVPLVRGRSRSRPLQEIAQEAQTLACNGYKEIVLSGICLGSYGKDLKPRKNLVDVLKAIEKIDGVVRVRLSSIEAKDVTDSLIDCLQNSKKVCHHLHIPIQSGDNTILKEMRRRYTREFYLRLIEKMRHKIPLIAITTDVLIGFPGETQAQFKNTLDLIKAICPLRVHAFPYSRRPGTAAESRSIELSPLLMRKRMSSLSAVTRSCEEKFMRMFLNKEEEVLVEEESKDYPGYWEGYTQHYFRVLIPSKKNLSQQLITVPLRAIKAFQMPKKDIGDAQDCGIIMSVCSSTS